MNTVIDRKNARLEEMFKVENHMASIGMESTQIVDDPCAAFQTMLATAPVMKGTMAECMGLPPEWCGYMYVPGFEYHTAVSFNAVNDAFMDDATFSSDFLLDMGLREFLGDTIVAMGGERHRRYRDTVQAHFRPGAVANWWDEKVIRRTVAKLISAIEKKGGADLNAELFARLPLDVITVGFGLSTEQGIDFRYNLLRGKTQALPEAERAAALDEAMTIVGDVIRSRQKNPQDDIISRITHAKFKEADGSTRSLTHQEVLAFCRLIVFAGGGATWRQLGITMLVLLNNPDQLEELRKDRSLIPNAVLESVRWHTTDPLFPRKVMKDTTLHGVDLPANSVLHLCLGSANYDPARWDNPQRFDIHRPVQRSMAFGTGVHSCLGQHVARQEIVVALEAILDRLPRIRWDDAKPRAKVTGGLMGRGPGPLHVVFG